MEVVELVVDGVAGHSPGPSRGDDCVLFSSSLSSQHKRVQVQRSDSTAVPAFALLRPAAAHSPASSVSNGLWTALQFEDRTDPASATVLVSTEQASEERGRTTCQCTYGVVARVEMHISAGSPLPRVVADGLKRVLPKVRHFNIERWSTPEY